MPRRAVLAKPVSGPPVRPDLRAVLHARLTAPIKGGGKTSALEAIVDALIHRAAAGDVRAAALVLDRTFGTVPDQVDVTTGGERLPVQPPIAWIDAAQVDVQVRMPSGLPERTA